MGRSLDEGLGPDRPKGYRMGGSWACFPGPVRGSPLGLPGDGVRIPPIPLARMILPSRIDSAGQDAKLLQNRAIPATTSKRSASPSPQPPPFNSRRRIIVSAAIRPNLHVFIFSGIPAAIILFLPLGPIF